MAAYLVSGNQRLNRNGPMCLRQMETDILVLPGLLQLAMNGSFQCSGGLGRMTIYAFKACMWTANQLDVVRFR